MEKRDTLIRLTIHSENGLKPEKQTELYEGLKEVDKLKDEFINIAKPNRFRYSLIRIIPIKVN